MILECPSCQTRYLVQIGLFAQGGRQVRCARCKHKWHATLPSHIDVVMPPADFVVPPAPEPAKPFVPVFGPAASGSAAKPDGASASSFEPVAAPQLPAVIEKEKWGLAAAKLLGIAALAIGLIAWPVLDREPIVKAVPVLRGFYEWIGLPVPPAWAGLKFERVKSELRYDSGTMKLFVDGVIHNTTSEVQLVPLMRVSALGPDRHVIQSWSIEPSAATIVAGGELDFHTDVATPLEQTIQDVNLEFFVRDEKDNADR